MAAPAVTAWALGTPLLSGLWERFAPTGVASAADWIAATVDELVAGGALRRDADTVFDA